MNEIINKYGYVIIIIALLLILHKFSFGMFFLVIGLLCLTYHFYRQNPNVINDDTRYELLKPKPKEIKGYTDIVNFLFSVQEMYDFNQQVFEDIVDKLDQFVAMYETILINTKNTNTHYELMDRAKYDILNNFHALILKIPSDPNVIEKHKRAAKVLEEILNKYLMHVLYLHKRNLYENGYNTNYKEIVRGPVAANYSLNNFV